MWERTTLTARDIDHAQLYDGFSFLTVQWLDALGFFPHGQAGDFVGDGERFGLDGPLPLNTSGGQLSGGRLHGVGFLHEACVQLWGEGGERQARNAPELAVVAVGGGPVAGSLLLSNR
jgi:acetyl-CoA acetyltransferase